LATLGDIYLRIGNSHGEEFPIFEWNSLVLESNRLLKIVARHARPAVVDTTAGSLAKIISASNNLGASRAMQNAAVLQSQKARAGKQVRTARRWRSIRCGIVWVCTKQKLRLTASDAFANSIRKDVIEAARRFGPDDLRVGTSTRSIERHIAALLKDRRLLNAILDECDLHELF
jgi:hypothetical protein